MTDMPSSPPPWAHVYPPNLDWQMDAVEKPVYALLDNAAQKEPDCVCIDFMDRHYTFADMLDLANRTARGLQQLGLGRGERVGLCLPNSPYYVAAYFGALKAGATVVNFNPLYTADEIRDQIIDADVSIMFTLGLKQIYPKVAAGLQGTNLRNIVVCSLADALPPVKSLLFQTFKRSEIAETPLNLQNLPFEWLTRNRGNYQPVEIDPISEVALLQYTGGTTGVPKGAMLTHANIMTNTEQVRSWLIHANNHSQTNQTHNGLSDDEPGGECILAALPFFHVFAMTVVMCLGLRIRAKQIVLPRFDLDQVLKVIDAKRPTLFPAVPTIYSAINGHAHTQRYDLTSIRHCLSGGAPLPLKIRTSFEKLTGCVLVEGYGLSETSPVACCNPPWGDNKAGSVGIPLPGTFVEIRDIANPSRTVPLGERGEIVIRGPQVMAGYWRRKEATRDAFEGRWLRTGDIGHMDEDGYVFLTDRMNDVINSGGYKIYLRIIEEALYKHPDVQEAVVIAIPHGYRGEAPKAFVKLVDGSNLDVDHLMAFCADHLNPIERPDEIEFRDELPKTLIGKLSKKELVEEEKQKRLHNNRTKEPDDG
ncbi:MAG: long-chain fatty acid--CoA ligase [Magnetovibrio sp.]|nr:long-chain fatty acid--CoA ligase [Magnetovibrio sp.]